MSKFCHTCFVLQGEEVQADISADRATSCEAETGGFALTRASLEGTVGGDSSLKFRLWWQFKRRCFLVYISLDPEN